MRDNKKISNCSFVLSLVTTESFSLPGFSLFLSTFKYSKDLQRSPEKKRTKTGQLRRNIALSAKIGTYRKIPKISPSLYTPPPPQTGNAKNPQLNRPSAEKEYKLRGGLYLENCPQIQSKTKKKR